MTIGQIKQLSEKIGLEPARGRGQNFLINQAVAFDMVLAAQIQAEDNILEVGPGFGILSEILVKSGANIVGVELDKKLYDYLKEKFAGQANLTLVEADILKVAEKLSAEYMRGKDFKMVANLPYQITGKLLRVFMERVGNCRELIIMAQKEVGERIIAAPGDMSMLALAVQYYGEPRILFEVGRHEFWPAPKVDSVVIKIDKNKRKPETGEAKDFFRVAKIGFSSPRKMLKNNLSNVFSPFETDNALNQAGLDLKCRAEQLSVQNWLCIAAKLKI